MSIGFMLTTLIIVATPGIGAIITIKAGLTQGAKASLLAAFACTLGIVPHILAAITGLAAVMHSSAVAFQAMKYLGVAYLLYMAIESWREHGSLAIDTRDAPRATRQVIANGIIANLLNPKLTIFFFAFLPQFVSNDAPRAWLTMVELSAVFMLVTFVVFALYGLFAATMRDRVLTRPGVMTWLRRVFAGSFVALGARLALAER